MAIPKKPPQPKLSPARQFDALKHLHLNGFEGEMGPNSWTAAFDLLPTPVSRTYRVQIDFYGDRSPKIYVLSPDIFALSTGRKPPHLYTPHEHPAHLCLFHPDRGDWARHMRVSETIVPWAAEWLLHFEVWLATNEWHGGGEHPSGRTRGGYAQRLENRWRQQRISTMHGGT